MCHPLSPFPFPFSLATQVADPIIHHGDVRRMVLTCRAISEVARCMVYDVSMMSDYLVKARSEKERKAIDEEMGFLTPILKGCLTELGCEAANLGMQCYGGHGFVKDYGMEQVGVCVCVCVCVGYVNVCVATWLR